MPGRLGANMWPKMAAAVPVMLHRAILGSFERSEFDRTLRGHFPDLVGANPGGCQEYHRQSGRICPKCGNSFKNKGFRGIGLEK